MSSEDARLIKLLLAAAENDDIKERTQREPSKILEEFGIRDDDCRLMEGGSAEALRARLHEALDLVMLEARTPLLTPLPWPELAKFMRIKSATIIEGKHETRDAVVVNEPAIIRCAGKYVNYPEWQVYFRYLEDSEYRLTHERQSRFEGMLTTGEITIDARVTFKRAGKYEVYLQHHSDEEENKYSDPPIIIEAIKRT